MWITLIGRYVVFVLDSVRFGLCVKSETHLFTPSHNSMGHIVLIGLF